MNSPNVCAVIVTYRPETALIAELLAAVASQVFTVIIVDNGSDADCLASLAAFAKAGPNRHVLALGENQGIAAAQNKGISRALTLNASHVLLLDHDSIPAQDMVRQLLLLESRLLTANIKVGAVGPTLIDRRTSTRGGFVRRRGLGISRVFPDSSTGFVETDFLIASGMLIRAQALHKIGLMNSGYFIDHVDTEWCFRAVHLGYRLFGAQQAVLLHTLGNAVMKIWLGRWREVPIHSPTRNYYIFRNTVSMVRHTPMSWPWRLAHVYRLTIFMAFFIMAGKPRAKRLGLMLRGIRDGLSGRQGGLDRAAHP